MIPDTAADRARNAGLLREARRQAEQDPDAMSTAHIDIMRSLGTGDEGELALEAENARGWCEGEIKLVQVGGGQKSSPIDPTYGRACKTH